MQDTQSWIEFLLDKNRFRRWMQQNPDKLVTRESPAFCPIATYLKEETHLPLRVEYDVKVYDDTVSLDDLNNAASLMRTTPKEKIKLPKWATRFIDYFDTGIPISNTLTHDCPYERDDFWVEQCDICDFVLPKEMKIQDAIQFIPEDDL